MENFPTELSKCGQCVGRMTRVLESKCWWLNWTTLQPNLILAMEILNCRIVIAHFNVLFYFFNLFPIHHNFVGSISIKKKIHSTSFPKTSVVGYKFAKQISKQRKTEIIRMKNINESRQKQIPPNSLFRILLKFTGILNYQL